MEKRFLPAEPIWEAAGMEPMAGCLCIGCLEKRIGRQLTPKDFMRKHPSRLLARREGREA